jgi:hypothetical protein
LVQNILKAYRDYVGLSRWPWRLVAKNISFFLALIVAVGLNCKQKIFSVNQNIK